MILLNDSSDPSNGVMESWNQKSYVLLSLNIKSTLNFEYEQYEYDIKISIRNYEHDSFLLIFLNIHCWSLVCMYAHTKKSKIYHAPYMYGSWHRFVETTYRPRHNIL